MMLHVAVTMIDTEAPEASEAPKAPKALDASRRDCDRGAVLAFLHECNELDHDFEFADIRTRGNEVTASVLVDGAPYVRDYMDPSRTVRRFCQALAEDLRRATGRAVFFSLEAGRLRIAA